jgi:hypothetical protein
MDVRKTMRWLFASEPAVPGRASYLWPRWIFLRALGLIYFSAFYSLVFQIQGLMGPQGIFPVKEYLEAVTSYAGHTRFWFAPTLLWLGSGERALNVLCWAGMAAAVLVVLNVWPRGALVVCFLAFLSFVTAAQDFSGYQSDDMLLCAGLVAMFFAPPGLRPGLGTSRAPSRASLFLLQWLWFRIYFESGVAKIRGGDPQWRNLTAMDQYYQNGPLPTWLGWYAQQLPHGIHAATAFVTLLVEVVLVWMLFLPRRFRVICFWIVSALEIGIILTANYTFLNYLVLALGFLLLDDEFIERVVPARWRAERKEGVATAAAPDGASGKRGTRLRNIFSWVGLGFAGVILGWVFYATTALLLWMVIPELPLPRSPVVALEPFRVASRFGLFGIMTRNRYEIEFQGSNDEGKTWTAYPFRYKPQDPQKTPGIYAPYQPRFDWNLWFASLGAWRESPMVLRTEERLLEGSPAVLSLFAGNPFPSKPPRRVRAVIWQYWFTDRAAKRATGAWWRRELLGLYAPEVERGPDGRFGIVNLPEGEKWQP